jgi:protein TonB
MVVQGMIRQLGLQRGSCIRGFGKYQVAECAEVPGGFERLLADWNPALAGLRESLALIAEGDGSAPAQATPEWEEVEVGRRTTFELLYRTVTAVYEKEEQRIHLTCPVVDAPPEEDRPASDIVLAGDDPAPLLAGVGGVTNPELKPESKVQPEYPELARVLRLESKVILQAIIDSDGSVRSTEVLLSSPPFLGFEESAVNAVTQWRYRPALQDGKPVDVYFTVFIEFKLR